MKFGPVPVAEAEGAILAHSVRHGDVTLKKGVTITAEDVARLAGAGVAHLVVARLEPGDVGEDAAAAAIAAALAGPGVRVEAPFTGRANLFAEAAGVFTCDAARVHALNALDPAVTVATLPPLRAVVAGEMIATVKIIPFAMSAGLATAARQAAGEGALAVAPFRAKRVAVISTVLPGLKPSVIDKTLAVLAARLAPAGATIISEQRVAHDEAALATALSDGAGTADLVIVFGASAITDPLDVIPAGLVAAGGRVDHLGMPVDPGNLLMLGHHGAVPVLGAPGCARSPRENGFDWVLQRLLADVPVTPRDIQAMGVGGLLMEIVSRPQPRAGDDVEPTALPAAPPAVAVVVLAAGRSTRMGAENKLTAPVGGKALVRHTVEQALASEVGPVLVVTGHQEPAVRAALAGLPVRFVANPDYAAGLSSSLKAGIAALPAETGGVLILLGDMPRVPAALIRRLAAVFAEQPGTGAVVPVSLAGRGNPVLIGAKLFPAVMALTGDAGARRLIDAAGADLIEVAVDEPSVHEDIDTPEALAALRQANT